MGMLAKATMVKGSLTFITNLIRTVKVRAEYYDQDTDLYEYCKYYLLINAFVRTDIFNKMTDPTTRSSWLDCPKYSLEADSMILLRYYIILL